MATLAAYDINAYATQISKEFYPHIMEISMEIAKKIIKKEVELSPDILKEVIMETIDKTNSDTEKITIKVNPEDVAVYYRLRGKPTYKLYRRV